MLTSQVWEGFRRPPLDKSAVPGLSKSLEARAINSAFEKHLFKDQSSKETKVIQGNVNIASDEENEEKQVVSTCIPSYDQAQLPLTLFLPTIFFLSTLLFACSHWKKRWDGWLIQRDHFMPCSLLYVHVCNSSFLFFSFRITLRCLTLLSLPPPPLRPMPVVIKANNVWTSFPLYSRHSASNLSSLFSLKFSKCVYRVVHNVRDSTY